MYLKNISTLCNVSTGTLESVSIGCVFSPDYFHTLTQHWLQYNKECFQTFHRYDVDFCKAISWKQSQNVPVVQMQPVV